MLHALLALWLAGPAAALNASKHNDADAPEYAGVVYIPRSAATGCTGALIGPRVVLTAAHCLRGARLGALLP